MREARQASSTEGSSTWQRVAVTAAGGTMLTLGLRRRTIPGYAAAVAGGLLLYRGLSGGEGREFELVSLEGAEASAEAVDVERTLTIQAPVDEVRSFLEDTDNLDRVLGETGSVTASEDGNQRWEIQTPIGQSLAWEMQREDLGEEGEMRWSSTGDADIEMTMSTKAAPGDRGTELTATLSFAPPAGSIGQALFERLDFVPHAFVGRTLRRIKSIIETGEAPTLAGSSSARRRPQP